MGARDTEVPGTTGVFVQVRSQFISKAISPIAIHMYPRALSYPLLGRRTLRAERDLQRSQHSCQGLFLPCNRGDVIQDNGTPFAANMQDQASGSKQEILKDIADLLVDPQSHDGKTIKITP